MADSAAIGLLASVSHGRGGAVASVELCEQRQPGHEFWRYEYRGFCLLLLGHCLLAPSIRATRFATAVHDDDLDSIAGWPGCYSALVLRPDGATAYSDLAGQFPLYYSERGGETLIGSDPGLIARRHQREFDPITAAAHIVCPAVLPLWGDRSPYTDVSRLAGGTILLVDGGSARVEPTRQPLPVEGMTLKGGADALRESLVAAVRDRCRGHIVSSDFSGGLDSTTIAFLAARYSGTPVSCIAYHQPLAPAGDLTEALRFGQLDPLINLTVVRGSEQTLPFSPTNAAPWPSEPTQGLLAAGRSAVRLAAASSAGATLHLTGEGGDAVLMSAPSYLGGMVRPGQFGTLFRHCGAYARLRYSSPYGLAWRAVRLRRTSAAQALGRLARELEQPSGGTGMWAEHIGWWPSPGQVPSWLTPQVRRQLAVIAADPATARKVPDGVGPADLLALADLQRSGEAQRFMRELGRPFGIGVHAPFLDSAVVRAALSVPAENRTDPWSYKPLLRAAMAGLVPDEILARHTKGDYSAETYRGAREAAADLRELLRDSRLAALGVIDPEAVGDVLGKMTMGIAVPLGPLNTVLATERWLRAADDVRRGVLAGC